MRRTAEATPGGVHVSILKLIRDRDQPVGEAAVAEAVESVPAARVVAAVQRLARVQLKGTRVYVHMIEAEGGTAELGEDWRHERMIDQVPVDLVPVECVLIVLKALGPVVLPAALALVGLGQEGGDGVGGEGAAEDNVLRWQQQEG